MLPLLALLSCLPAPHRRPATPADAKDLDLATTVEIAQGTVIGVSEDGVRSWLGVPFAKPPVGALRWRPAQPPAPFAGPFVADRSAAPCVQGTDWTETRRPKASEDCLALDIRAGRGGAAKPVMVWLHGGGYTSGAAGGPTYDASRIVQRHDVIVVNVAYRLGPLGFLAHPAFTEEDPAWPSSGNYGLTDQLQALRWVQENIAAFGGDPNNVTVFGESAGGGSVCHLMTSPLAEGLFHKAIVQSGVCLDTAHLRTLERGAGGNPSAHEQGRAFAEAAGCGGSDDVAACLRALPAEAVREAMPSELVLTGPRVVYGPIIDGHVLPQGPLDAAARGETAKVPLLLGFNQDEGSLFVQRWHIGDTSDFVDYARWSFKGDAEQVMEHYGQLSEPLAATRAAVGDDLFVCPSEAFARLHAQAGNDTFLYHMTHVSKFGELSGLGAYHASDLELVFGNAFSGRGEPDLPPRLVESVQRWWTQFAQAGAPGEAMGLAWQRVDAGYMQLDWPLSFQEGRPNGETCDMLARIRAYPSFVVAEEAEGEAGPEAQAGDKGGAATQGSSAAKGDTSAEGEPQSGRAAPSD